MRDASGHVGVVVGDSPLGQSSLALPRLVYIGAVLLLAMAFVGVGGMVIAISTHQTVSLSIYTPIVLWAGIGLLAGRPSAWGAAVTMTGTAVLVLTTIAVAAVMGHVSTIRFNGHDLPLQSREGWMIIGGVILVHAFVFAVMLAPDIRKHYANARYVQRDRLWNRRLAACATVALLLAATHLILLQFSIVAVGS